MFRHRLTANEVPNTARRAFIEAKKPIESGRVQHKDRVKNLLLYISDYNTRRGGRKTSPPPLYKAHLLSHFSTASTDLITVVFLYALMGERFCKPVEQSLTILAGNPRPVAGEPHRFLIQMIIKKGGHSEKSRL